MPKQGPELSCRRRRRAGLQPREQFKELVLEGVHEWLVVPAQRRIDDDRILELMMHYEDPVRCCRALTEAACAAGGPDNVTVAVARFVGEGLPVPHGREPVAARRSSHTLQ